MANRFWVGGTGTWNNTSTAFWSTTSGGAGGSSVPGASDIALFDGSSGGGTVTVDSPNGAGVVTLQAINCGAFTGTLDFSANNNNVTLSGASSNAFNGSGTGTRTINLGSGTWTLSGAMATWTVATTTGLTASFANATIVFTGVSTGAGVGLASFHGGGQSYGTVHFNANNGVQISGNNTIATLQVTGANDIQFPSGGTTTITNAFTITGGSSTPISFRKQSTTTTTITTGSATSNTVQWGAFHGITFTAVGGSTLAATNSLDLGQNSGTGFTITAPSVGGASIIGG